MKLLIVESPHKIKTLSKIVGEDYKIIASYGHVRDLSRRSKDGLGINILNDFTPKFGILPDKVEVIQNILDNAEKADEILLATDPDREGEAISYHIYEFIKDFGKPIKRISFIEITKDGVLGALAKPRDIDMNLVNSQICRRVLDRIVGFMVSPYLMGKYRKTLSAGRVQSVATRMIIDREEQIKKFEPKEYWNISVNLQKEGQSFRSKFIGEVNTEAAANEIRDKLSLPDMISDNFEIVSVSAKSKPDMPKPPFNTSKMQQAMANRFGMDGEVCMEKAQSLYEKGLISYIRTDSVKTSETALHSLREYLKKNNIQIPKNPHTYEDKDSAQSAHECIRPTSIELHPDEVNIQPDETKLYRAIWEQFASSQMMPAIYDTIDVKIKHKESNLLFRTAGKALKYKGYLEFSNANLGKINLPNFSQGESIKYATEHPIALEQKFTKPPSRYSNGSFIEELENKGVGRPSTFASICKTITSRAYVENRDNTFFGTDLGSEITHDLEKYFKFMEYDYTSKLERQLDDIERGKMTGTETLTGFYREFKERLNQAHSDNKGILCKSCNSPVYHRTSKEGKEYNICSLHPYCRFKTN
jgi:DNA topoisomerase-1